MTPITNNPYNWNWRAPPVDPPFTLLPPRPPIYIPLPPYQADRPNRSEVVFYQALNNGAATTSNFNFYINSLTQTQQFDTLLSLLRLPRIISLANCTTFNMIIKAAGIRYRFDIAAIFYAQAFFYLKQVEASIHTNFMAAARKCEQLQAAIELCKTINLKTPEDCIELFSAIDRQDTFEIAEFIYMQMNHKEYLRSPYVYMSYIHTMINSGQPLSKITEVFETAKKLDMADGRVKYAYGVAKQRFNNSPSH